MSRRALRAAPGIPASTLTANSVLAGDSNGNAQAVALAASQVLGRAAAGGLVALTASQIKTIVGLATSAAPALVNSAGGALATVPADVSVGSLTLLTEAITAIGTLQTAVNALLHLNNQVFTILKNNGLGQ